MTNTHATSLLPCDGCAEIAAPAPRVLLRHLDGSYCQPCAVEIISDCAGGPEFLAELDLPEAPASAHTETARAIAATTGWDLDQSAADREWGAVGVGPVGRTRDSEALELSNFEVIYADLSEQFGDAVTIDRFGHWACGWVEEITWDASRAEIVSAVEAWRTALDDYPVADDMHFSETEWTENHPSEGECYSDDDCSCETNLTHLEALDGTGCNGDQFTPKNLTGDTSEVQCAACLAVTAPRYATPGQSALFTVASAS